VFRLDKSKSGTSFDFWAHLADNLAHLPLGVLGGVIPFDSGAGVTSGLVNVARKVPIVALLLATGIIASPPVSTPASSAPLIVGMAALPSPTPDGYWLVDAEGKVHAFGTAQHVGDNTTIPTPTPDGFVDILAFPVPTPDGYWLLDSAGRVQNYGGAPHFGDNISQPCPSPDGFVGMATYPSPTPTGYWLLHASGQACNFGGAPHLGDNFSQPDPTPDGFVGIANLQSPSPDGYWLVDSVGRVLNFGSSEHLGDWPTTTPPQIIAIEGIPDPPGRQAYWLANEIGQVYTFGLAQHYGDLSANPPAAPIADIAVTEDGLGYWLVDQQGKVYAFGNAPFLGDLSSPPGPPAVGGTVELLASDGVNAQFSTSEALSLRQDVALIFAATGAVIIAAAIGGIWHVRRHRGRFRVNGPLT
jgi:hypothetical protein